MGSVLVDDLWLPADECEIENLDRLSLKHTCAVGVFLFEPFKSEHTEGRLACLSIDPMVSEL